MSETKRVCRSCHMKLKDSDINFCDGCVKKRIDKMDEQNAAYLLKKSLQIPLNQIPDEMIDLKREQITIKRLLKETRNGLTGTGN